MLMLFYVLLAWSLTPLVYDLVNRRMTAGMTIRWIVAIKGSPAWFLNVAICSLISLVVMLLPGGWAMGWWNYFVLFCIVFFGNQAFFNTVVKPVIRKARGEE